MTTTKVFQNGNSQALRIPQNMRTEIKDYYIGKIGEIYIAYPADDPWACTRQVIGDFPDDFMNDREQPSWNEVSPREDL
ncbi:MAG: AbrB/MazE/SpoVT family DNA-binding domain-containing protein [Lachnospiraceae bacterium]|jgi:antitoxin VapB|nr:AbrB/MazE/SpoVT family DNA-binding domain-containing protein [Lachnospiraceae bacterium]